jgi:hypothetical protein
MVTANRASIAFVLAMASAPVLGLLITILLRYGLGDGWAQIAYASWSVAAVGLVLVIVVAVTLASAFAAGAAARTFRPRR